MRPPFSIPAMYITLPSDTILGNLTQHPVYPSCAIDEITMRTPDSLLTGRATLDVIQHCCPTINTSTLLMCDVPYVLGSIKIASDGKSIELSIKCGDCGATDSYDTNIQPAMEKIAVTDWFSTIHIPNQIDIKLFPPTYEYYRTHQLEKFKIEKQLFQLSELNQKVESDAYYNYISELNKKHKQLERNFYFSAIQCAYVNGTPIYDKKNIIEWYDNTDVSAYEQIHKAIDGAYASANLPKMDITCDECGKSLQIPLNLDFSDQFKKRLIPLDTEEIQDELKKMQAETKQIQENLLKIIWHMRGSVSYSESVYLSTHEREVIGKIIEDNIEASKKIGFPVL